jgi:hypothetical protein
MVPEFPDGIDFVLHVAGIGDPVLRHERLDQLFQPGGVVPVQGVEIPFVFRLGLGQFLRIGDQQFADLRMPRLRGGFLEIQGL